MLHNRIPPLFLVLLGHLIGISTGTDQDRPATLPEKPNILFIAIDDLRPELGCYGAEQVKTPHIDRFANRAVVFNRAYCQVPVCGPSRASLLTGVRPTRETCTLWNAEEFAPNVPTLPQWFREAGYHTISNGKIFHDPRDSWRKSWSEPPSLDFLAEHDRFLMPGSVADAQREGKQYPFFEAANVPDTSYVDGRICERTIEDLHRLKAMGKPFFLGCGFIRPHLPFNAPKKYWDLYDRSKIRIATNRFRPVDAPESLKGSTEIQMYATRGRTYNSDHFHKLARHGYYVSVSYVDAQIGRLLNALEVLDLARNTIVVIWGDHGWHLGEHDYWSKHNLMHQALHAPLLLRVPGMETSIRVNAIVEFIDIYPTLCTLAGLRQPSHLDGSSLLPVILDPKTAWKQAAYARYENGHTVISQRFAFTQYHDGLMLFDLQMDPQENINVVSLPEYRQAAVKMIQMLRKDAPSR